MPQSGFPAAFSILMFFALGKSKKIKNKKIRCYISSEDLKIQDTIILMKFSPKHKFGLFI